MKKLMTHLYFGDPSKEFSIRLAKTLVESGADILEIGIPYSDPVCDGEIFQRACKRALDGGVTPDDVLRGIGEIRDIGDKIPICLTSYYGPIFKLGVREFVQRAQEVGAKGLIVPDLLLEEQGELRKACDTYGLSLIQFATVYSTKERLRRIIEASTDFIYFVSLPGVTGNIVHPGGARFGHPRGGLHVLLRLLKKMTEKPIYVGFGIKDSQDVKKIFEMGADGVIVGSAIARMYEKNLSKPEKMLPEVTEFIKKMKASTIRL